MASKKMSVPFLYVTDSGDYTQTTRKQHVFGSLLPAKALNIHWSLASCLIYAPALLEYVIFITCLHSVSKMLPSVKFAEDKVLTFLIVREKC